MAAAEHDIIIEENSDLVLGITWYDRDGLPEHVDPYGALFVLKKDKDRHSKPFVVVTHNPSDAGEIVIGENPGEFIVRVDWSVLKVLDFDKGYYQLDIHPVAEEPNNRRQRLLKGQAFADISLWQKQE